MADILERLQKRQAEEQQIESVEAVGDPSRSVTERLAERQRLAEQGIRTADPIAMDTQTREEFLAQQTGREFLAEPGLKDAGLRADLGLSDTFEEKKAKFIDKFPDGDFIMVFEPRTDPQERPQTILFRRHPNEDFAELDARAVDRFELLGDVSDISGEIPAVAMEALFIRGGSIVKNMWQAALGTLTGDLLKEGIEEARDYQQETLPQFASREAVRVGLSGVGAGATAIVTGPINSLRGAPLVALKKSAPQAQRAGKRLGLPNFLPGQLSRSPFLQKMQGQASAIFKTVGDHISAQQGAMARALGRMREGDVKKVLADEVESVFNEGREQIVKAAQLTPNRSLTESGSAIQQGIAEWDDLASMLTRWGYKRAREIEEPVFDLQNLRSVATDLDRGTRGVGAGGDDVLLSRLDPELKSVVDDILALDPSLPTFVKDGMEVTSLDQLRALRSRLWDLKTPNVGEIAREPQKQAARLYGTLTKTMRDVKNASPEFVEAWRKADSMAKARFDTMEQLMVIEAGKSAAPGQLAANLAQPNQVDNLRVLRNTMPDSKWREFQEATRADFISPEKIDNLTKRLDTFDQATLDVLFTKTDQEALRTVGQRIDELNQVGIKQSLQLDASHAAMVQRLAVNNDTQSIARLVAESRKRPKLRRSIRAGLMEDVWNAAVRKREGVQTTAKQAITAKIKEFRESGALGFLEKSDIRMLKEFETIAELIPEFADSGTSLVAASAVSATTRVSGEGFKSAIKNMTIGRLLTSPSVSRWILGRGKEPSPFNTIRNFGSFLGREIQALPVSEENIPERPNG